MTGLGICRVSFSISIYSYPVFLSPLAGFLSVILFERISLTVWKNTLSLIRCDETIDINHMPVCYVQSWSQSVKIEIDGRGGPPQKNGLPKLFRAQLHSCGSIMMEGHFLSGLENKFKIGGYWQYSPLVYMLTLRNKASEHFPECWTFPFKCWLYIGGV